VSELRIKFILFFTSERDNIRNLKQLFLIIISRKLAICCSQKVIYHGMLARLVFDVVI